MKKNISFLCVLLIVSSCFSFSVRFPGVHAFSVAETIDSTGFIATGWYSNVLIEGPLAYHLPIYKLDNTGDILWYKKHNEGSEAKTAGTDIIRCSDGNFIICGAHIDTMTTVYSFYLLKIDPDGVILFENSYGLDNDMEYAWAVIETRDNGFLVVGTSLSYSTIVALRVDEHGDEIWMRRYPTDGFVFVYNCVELVDTTFLISASLSGLVDGILLKINNDGDALWTRLYDSQQIGSLYHFGDNIFGSSGIAIDTAGNIIHDYALSGPSIVLREGKIANYSGTGSTISIINPEGAELRSFDIHCLLGGGVRGRFYQTYDNGFVSVSSFGGSGRLVSATKIDSMGFCDNQVTIDVKRGWNALSYPFVDEVSFSTDYLPHIDFMNFHEFRTASGTYGLIRRSKPGVGFFALSTIDTVYTLDSAYRVGYIDLILYRGWNLISGPATNVPADRFFEQNPGPIAPLYYYDPEATSYFPADTIRPGIGYWLLSPIDSLEVRMW